MNLSWLPLVLLLMTSIKLFIGVKGTGLPVEDGDHFDSKSCTGNTQCDENQHLVCNTTKQKCRCDTENLWKKSGDKCVKQEELYQKCGTKMADPLINCSIPGSVCTTTDFAEPRMSCVCDAPDYVDVENPGEDSTGVPDVYRYICAKVLPRDTSNDCQVCNPIASKCYGLPQKGGGFNEKRNGCKCDVSFSGDKCQTVNVNVSCNMTERIMDVCYLPHADVNSSQPVKIYVTDLYDHEACRGKLVTTNGTKCSPGYYTLSVNLPTDDTNSDKDTCGTKMTQKDQMKRFENTIQVEKGGTSDVSHAFTVYCQFEHSTFISAGFIVYSVPENNRGESLFANVSMLVLDSTGKALGDSARIHTRDKIRFLVQLNADDTYGALLPTYCTASPYGSWDSPKGININKQLLIDSCPVTDMPLINQMRFRRKNGQSNVMITEEMNMIKLKVSDTVYVHCKVKLCLRGSEDACNMPNCTSKRQKRAAEDIRYDEEETNVKLTFVDDKENGSSGLSTVTMTTMGFAIIISLLVALVTIVVTALVVLVMRLRTRANDVNDTVQLTDKPQRFALPRISRNHLRI